MSTLEQFLEMVCAGEYEIVEFEVFGDELLFLLVALESLPKVIQSWFDVIIIEFDFDVVSSPTQYGLQLSTILQEGVPTRKETLLFLFGLAARQQSLSTNLGLHFVHLKEESICAINYILYETLQQTQGRTTHVRTLVTHASHSYVQDLFHNDGLADVRVPLVHDHGVQTHQHLTAAVSILVDGAAEQQAYQLAIDGLI